MLKRKLGRSQSQVIEESPINLTPLIDVVFVVLIVFILAAPLLNLDRVELADASAAPLENTGPTQSSSPISIHVRQDNTILINQTVVSVDHLGSELARARQRYPTARPQLFHDRRAHFGIYQAIKNAAEEAGFSEMDIILKPA
jgi:biopolymer transport protein ExbD